MSSSVSGYYHGRNGLVPASPPPGSLGSRNSTLSVDEAYRRLGYRLSKSVGGHHMMGSGSGVGGMGVASLMLQQPSMRFSSRSAFEPPSAAKSAVPPIQLFPLPYQQQLLHRAADDASDATSLHTATSMPESLYDREAKVAKLRREPPSAKKRSANLLRQLTMFAKDNFASWEEDGRHVSKINGGSKEKQAQQQYLAGKNGKKHQDDDKPKGFLHMALEGGSAASKTPAAKCLTTPSEPTSNNHKDNAEGNLIVYQGDVILPTQVQSVWASSAKMPHIQNHGWKVLGLLGQGTFAQVFECQHLETNERVAIKVVKNKTAYTRQAAVEIDVFQALHQTAAATAASAPDGRSTSPSRENMVHLECYFMYQQHLCLVFELLGLNLYEVLKKRQFRGLSLRVVKSLLKQAMDGIKLLSQKQIVHCDLKPENILLVNDGGGSAEAEKELVGKSEGEPKRRGVDLLFESQAAADKIQAKSREKPKQSTTLSMATTTTQGSTSSSSSSGDGSGHRSTDTYTCRSSASTKEQSSTNAATNGTPLTQDSSLISQSFDRPSRNSGSSRCSQKEKIATPPEPRNEKHPHIKLIDFGSACFEGHTAHTYIQSRFYRSPEVLIGLPYDSSIDMWSLGCVAAELFLGLPILPGVHEHDQLSRICEMIGSLPDWMLDQGSKSAKYFVKQFTRQESGTGSSGVSSSGSVGTAIAVGTLNKGGGVGASVTPPPRTPSPSSLSAGTAPPRPAWRIKTQSEYVQSLSASEIRKKGGLSKLEKQNTNRYFKRKKLSDIVKLHGHQKEDKEQLGLFIHFLMGILEPDPWKRWTAFQASQHPFITGSTLQRRRQGEDAVPAVSDGSLTHRTTTEKSSSSSSFDIYWVPPWDPSICRRKLLNVQKTREKQQALRRSYGGAAASASSVRSSAPPHGAVVVDAPSPDKVMSRKMMDEPPSPTVSQASTGRVTAMTDAMSLSRHSGTAAFSQSAGTGASSPLPSTFVVSSGATSSANTGSSSIAHQSAPHTLAGSLGSGIVGSSIPPASAAATAYMASSSLTDYHQQAAAAAAAAAHHPSVMMASPHMHGLSYGDVAQGAPHGAMMVAPQSYQGSVGSYSGLQQVPLDADFGYALQRPGVVPGAGDLSSSYTLNQGTATAATTSGPMAFSPHHHLQSHGRASSYSSGTARSSRYRRQQFSQPQHGSFRGTATASIQEDAADSKSSSATSGTSLLAQQLEETSATHSSRSQMDGLLQLQQQQHQQQQMYYMQRIHGQPQHPDGQQQPPMTPMDAAKLQQHSMPHNYMPAQQVTSYGYYTHTYVTANGAPLPQGHSIDMRSSVLANGGFSSYGSYNNEPMNPYVSPASLHAHPQQQQHAPGLPTQYAAAPSYLAQPSFGDMERQAAGVAHQMQHQGGLNPSYRGMSM